MPKSAMELVNEARQRIEELSADQVAQELQAGALLVDVRESDERREHGIIPGTVHMPRGMLEFYADPSLPYHRKELEPNRRIILHCASGGRSALAAELLTRMGYANVAHLAGGIDAWRASGGPIEYSA